MSDEDWVQDFVIGVWHALPIRSNNFSAWIRTRLEWRSKNHHRQAEREAEVIQPAPELSDEDGDLISIEDSLDLLMYRWHRSTGEDAGDFEDEREPPNLGLIDDSVIRRTAELLLRGRTQESIAGELGLSPTALRMRLYRYRRRTWKLAA